MLRKVRIVLATVFFLCITGLFLDFTGVLQKFVGWMAKLQFLPAVLGMSIVPILAVLLLTLLMGRLYCSVICPLGVFQDVVAWISRKFRKKPYGYSRPKTWVRITVLIAFVVLIVAGFNGVALLVAPYSAYGRMVNGLLQPAAIWINNLFASVSASNESYVFGMVEPRIFVLPLMLTAVFTFFVIVILAAIGGRTYCNTICPVGTVLGWIARFSWFKPHIDTDKCKSCGKCVRNCKAHAISIEKNGPKTIDYTRCVTCGNCIEECSFGALSYCHPTKGGSSQKKVDTGLRAMISTAFVLGTSSLVKAQELKADGGLAVIEDKKMPERNTRIVPPGAESAANLAKHCTGCQLCVSNCPNRVLRPSGDLDTFLQPFSSYEAGYCRPECTLCSEVCPTGAIKPVTKEEKSSIQVGHAVWIRENCIPVADGVACGNCARHCPSGAIQMVPLNQDENSASKSGVPQLLIPAINPERCIGCGACENLCPSRPFSAIYVEGHMAHRII